jgi:hypothetical protein
MKELLLHKGMVALVDDEDYLKVADMKWHVMGSGHVCNTKYVRGSGRKNQKSVHMYLHRFIMDAPKGKVVDHINRNPLDNRRSNLRICDQSTNIYNSGTFSNNKSGIRGVAWHSAAKKWEAFIHNANKKIYLGVFDNIVDAQKARAEAFDIYYEK